MTIIKDGCWFLVMQDSSTELARFKSLIDAQTYLVLAAPDK